MKSTTMLLALLLLGCIPLAAAGQEAEARAAAEQGRRAQPRERAPRSEPAPAAAPAPVRQPAPARQDDGGRARSRGTDDYGRVRAPRDRDAAGDRESGGRRERGVAAAAAPPSSSPPASSAPPATASSTGSEEQERERRRAVPRGSRPRGDNPAVGRAEPRDGRQYPRDGRVYPGGRGSSRVYTSRGRVYNNYYYNYPRRWYPYGYGAFGGLGYFYYDPYTWYSYDPYWSRPHHYNYYSRYRDYGDSYYDTGELRLQVHPRHAEVYVDGYFAGHVDDFDGVFQGLRLEEGPYRIEIVAPGHETLEFEVRILPGRKTTYRGDLRRRP
jgi:hypothetical protein